MLYTWESKGRLPPPNSAEEIAGLIKGLLAIIVPLIIINPLIGPFISWWVSTWHWGGVKRLNAPYRFP